MKLHELLAVTNDVIIVEMRKDGSTMLTLKGTVDNLFRYGYLPNIEVIGIRREYGYIAIECDIDSIKGA